MRSSASSSRASPSFCLPVSAGLEDGQHYRFRIRPVLATQSAGEWGWSPSSPVASPAILNAFLKSQLPEQLVSGGGGSSVVPRNSLAGKIVGE